MKPQYTLLQKEIDPSLTILFKETNPYHPEIISDRSGFGIVIEDWKRGIYRFVNSTEGANKITNDHFTPNNAKPLKSIHDLNNLWKTITGESLTYIGKQPEKIEVGKVYPTNRNGTMKVIEILEGNKSKVIFENGYTTIAQNVNIFRGRVKNLYYPSLFGVGYIGEGKYDSTTKEVYRGWKGILQRCYDEKSRHIYKSYSGVTVCEEWKCLQDFGKWYEENYDHKNMEGWALDKDLIDETSREYSPSNCSFVPPTINNIFVKIEGKDNGQPTGVRKERNKYFVYFYKGGDIFHSKGYDTSEEAYKIYITEKRKYAKELAEEHKNFLDIRVYNKLITY